MIGTLALERLNLAGAIGMAISGEEGQSARDQARRLAFPMIPSEG